MKLIVSIFFVLIIVGGFTSNSYAQGRIQYPWVVGIEQDVLPYILKGFIGTVWVGKEGWRGRASYAQAISPAFVLGDGIKQDRVTAYGLSAERFFRLDFKGWWIGPGIGYWDNEITTEENFVRHHQSFIISAGSGYLFQLTKNIYFSTWTACHFRATGLKHVDIHGTTYRPAFVIPEISLKVGIRFPKARYVSSFRKKTS